MEPKNSLEALDNLVHCKSETKCKECKHKNVCTLERDYNIVKSGLEQKEQFIKQLKNENIISMLDLLVKEIAKEEWRFDDCPPEFWVSLDSSDVKNQAICLTINHLGSKFTEKIFPRPTATFGYDTLLNYMTHLYNRTM